jgi:hypothetical protein
LYTFQTAGPQTGWRPATQGEVNVGVGFVPDIFILTILAVVAAVPVAIVLFAALVRRRAKQFGYPSTGAYLRAAPRSDAEKRDAADLVLKGLVFCMLGLILSPFVLVGLIPLFYGGRKLLYTSMGLGLVDDPDQPGA